MSTSTIAALPLTLPGWNAEPTANAREGRDVPAAPRPRPLGEPVETEVRTRPLRLGSPSRPWEPDPRTFRHLAGAISRPVEITAGVEIARWAEQLAELDRRHVVDVRLVADAPERRVLDAVRALADRGLAVRVHRRPGHDSEARLQAFLSAARAAGAVDVEIAWPRFGRSDDRRGGLRRLRLQLGMPRLVAARG